MPKNTKIKARKESLISRELVLIMRDLNNEVLNGVGISEVRLVNDNELAKIYYSFLPLSGQNITKESIQTQLDENKVKIRKILASKLDMRYVPDLQFVYDDSLDNANHIDELLNKYK